MQNIFTQKLDMFNIAYILTVMKLSHKVRNRKCNFATPRCFKQNLCR